MRAARQMASWKARLSRAISAASDADASTKACSISLSAWTSGAGGVLGGQARCSTFHDLAHGVELEHLGNIEVAHDQPAAAGGLDEAAGRETAKRLTDRRAADLQPLRDLFLAQPVAGTVTAGLERLAQRAEHGFAQCHAAAACDRSARLCHAPGHRSLTAHPAHAEMALAAPMYIFVYKGTQWLPWVDRGPRRQNVSNFVASGRRDEQQIRRAGDRRRQCGTVRGDLGAPRRCLGAGAGGRAKILSRRQHPPHPQHALRP